MKIAIKKRFLAIQLMTAAIFGVAAVSPAAQADEGWGFHRHYRPYGYGYGWHRPPVVFSTFCRPAPVRYVIVPSANCPPAIAPQTLVINVPNSNGSYTSVPLTVASNGTFIGPQGEIYPTQPTVEQLRQMYGS